MVNRKARGVNPRLLVYRMSRAVLRRFNIRRALQCAVQRNRKVILFRGIASKPDWQVHFASTEHFLHDIPAVLPRRRHDYRIAQNFMHQEFVDDPGPKVFFSREPEAVLTEETRRNLSGLQGLVNVLSFGEEDPEQRMYYVALPSDRRGVVRRLAKTMHESRPRFCCIVNRHKSNDELELLRKRYDFVEAMQGAIDVYGRPPDEGPNPWDGFPGYRGAAGNKLRVLRSYTFNLCFENCDRDGYITEKMPHALMAGCVPLYWGGGRFLEQTIPPACYINCKGKEPREVFQRIRSMPSEEVFSIRRAGLEFLASPDADRFCWKFWATQCIDSLLVAGTDRAP